MGVVIVAMEVYVIYLMFTTWFSHEHFQFCQKHISIPVAMGVVTVAMVGWVIFHAVMDIGTIYSQKLFRKFLSLLVAKGVVMVARAIFVKFHGVFTSPSSYMQSARLSIHWFWRRRFLNGLEEIPIWPPQEFLN